MNGDTVPPPRNPFRLNIHFAVLLAIMLAMCGFIFLRQEFTRTVYLIVYFLALLIAIALISMLIAYNAALNDAIGSLNDTRKKYAAIEARNRQLETAVGKLEEVERLKKNFLMMASHQMRSPLVAIQSVIRVIVSGAATGNEEDTRNLLQQAYIRSEDMLEMINDILNLAEARVEIDEGTEETNAASELNNVVSLLRPVAAEQKVAIELSAAPDIPPTRIARKWLNHIFTNLVDNAVKYSMENTAVRVRLANENNMLRLDVEDSGIGIPEEDQKKLFKEFYRADNAKTLRKQGTGLGLTIVQNIVRNLGGTLSFTSKENEGTHFIVHLPFVPKPPPKET